MFSVSFVNNTIDIKPNDYIELMKLDPYTRFCKWKTILKPFEEDELVPDHFKHINTTADLEEDSASIEDELVWMGHKIVFIREECILVGIEPGKEFDF